MDGSVPLWLIVCTGWVVLVALGCGLIAGWPLSDVSAYRLLGL